LFKLNNYLSIIIVSVCLLLAISFNSFSHISTKLDTILPNSHEKELLSQFHKFQSNKKILISIKGFDSNTLKEIREIEKKLNKIDGLKIDNLKRNKQLEKYKQNYTFYLNEIDKTKLININIKKELADLKEQILKADFSYKINKQDPLKLINKKELKLSTQTKNGHLILKGYGYLTIFSIDSTINTLDEYELLYDEIKNITPSKLKTFSPIFYFVENSRTIKKDINKIIILSTIFLFLLYLIILRNIKLLFNSVNTIASSILFALFITSLIFESISIFVLVFGISVSTVAIDYMFHNYMHNYYYKKRTINKDVFFGMATTVGAFFILSFTSFDLIKQLSYFCIVSLVFSYLQFTFIFRRIGFKRKDSISFENFKFKKKIKASYIFFLSLIIIIFSSLQVKFDSNLKNLDVENIKLKQDELFFTNKLKQDTNINVLLKTKTIEELINKASVLKDKYPNSHIPISSLITENKFIQKQKELKFLQLEKLKIELVKHSQELGFKSTLFEDAYKYKDSIPKYNLDYLNTLNIEVLKYKELYITHALLPKSKISEYENLEYIQLLSIKELFEKKLMNTNKELLTLGSLTIIFILLMLFISTKKNYFIALSFLSFPLAVILLLSVFIEFNILHTFMIFIILAIGIDFGIYMSSQNIDKNTYKAIIYSLLSTFAGFGVLIFSNISSLFSIGIIATIGILSIAILLLILKRI
jgi:predicted exporter